MNDRRKKAEALLYQVLSEDPRVHWSIWTMELNQEAFCEYVLISILALLQAGENNCRFLIFLLDHLLYHL